MFFFIGVAIYADALSKWVIFKANFTDSGGEEGKKQGKTKTKGRIRWKNKIPSENWKLTKKVLSFSFAKNAVKLGIFCQK